MKIKEFFYKLKYYNKFKKFGFDDNFRDFIISCLDRKDHIKLLKLIDSSNTKEQFVDNTINLYYENRINTFVPDLLIGNVVGKYQHFVNGYEGINLCITVDPNFFKSDKLDLIAVLKEKFYDYVMSNNEIKNSVLLSVGNDLSTDISKEILDNIFDSVIDGKKVDEYIF